MVEGRSSSLEVHYLYVHQAELTDAALKVFYAVPKVPCHECVLHTDFRVFFLDEENFAVETSQSFVWFGNVLHKGSGKFSNTYFLWAKWADMVRVSVPTSAGGYLCPPFPDMVLKVQTETENALLEVSVLQKLMNKRAGLKPTNYRIAFPMLQGISRDHTCSSCPHSKAIIRLSKGTVPQIAILMTFQGVPLHFLREVIGKFPTAYVSPAFFEKQFNAISEIMADGPEHTVNLSDRHAGNFVFWPEPRWVVLQRDAMWTFPLSIIDFNLPVKKLLHDARPTLENLVQDIIGRKLKRTATPDSDLNRESELPHKIQCRSETSFEVNTPPQTIPLQTI